MVDYSKTAFVFPGQGSQIVGMGKDIADAYPIAHQTIQTADEILGFELSKWMFEGPEEKLSDTAITQPAMYVCSVAIYRALLQEAPDAIPASVAGHSLGEFTALTVAGSLAYEDGLLLVRERGRLMKEAGEQNPGGMAAILGLEVEKVLALVNEASTLTGKPVVIANDNCPGQVVISGDTIALEKAVSMAKDYGAKRALPLAVSVATHSPLMQPASEAFTKLVASTQFSVPKMPVYANVSAQPIQDVDLIRAELEAQLTNSVQWTRTIEGMIANGISHFVEIGSKDVLTGLLKRINKEAKGTTINHLPSLQDFVQGIG